MKTSDERQLMIEILSGNSNDTAVIAAELDRELGDAAKVQLTSKESPVVNTRSVDPRLVLEVISVTLAGVETFILLAMLLNDLNKKKSGHTLMLTNPRTGKKVKLLETDSLKKVEKKIRKVLEKEKVRVSLRKG